MSVVTNIILTFPICDGDGDEEVINALNEHLKNTPVANGSSAWFGIVSETETSGTKAVETNVCFAAFNHLDLNKLLDLLRTFDWPDKSNVQVFVQGENENRFTERGL